MSFIVLSCSEDDEDPISPPNSNTETSTRYYVKYDVTFTTYHINPTRVIKFATEKGIQTIMLENQSKSVSWNGTYGPVDKNFTASIEGSTPGYDYPTTVHAKISVCRDKEPFVIKAEDEASHSLSLSYKIDF